MKEVKETGPQMFVVSCINMDLVLYVESKCGRERERETDRQTDRDHYYITIIILHRLASRQLSACHQRRKKRRNKWDSVQPFEPQLVRPD